MTPSDSDSSPRIAPHSIEAEEAVLGSVLIDPESLYRVLPFLTPGDFFLVKNQWVWQAILALHERREPIDLLTVGEELERRGQLADVGGQAYLSHLVNVVPTAIHAEGYGRIVEQTSIRRKLLAAASDIAQLAYKEDQEIDEVIDNAEQALFSVSERRIARELVPISDIIRSYYARIEYLYEHRGEPLGIPTGFVDLDRLLGGLQRSDLVIVAARPGVGKTSLLLSMGLHAARRIHQRVAIFSLEMSSEQVVQRLISQETGIDSQRLRLGDLREEEWPLFVEASGALSSANLFIDDTPSISALQLRTKARRLHAEIGLDLIIVDYLQLMTGDIRAENRVQEIAYISRSLKGLARELNVPVLAASQLSRAVEQRHDKRPLLSDLRESGCLTGETLIPLENGQRVPIRNLEGKSNFSVWALNPATMKLEARPVSRAFCTGTKPVFRMRTRLGREIRATANHRFLTIEGWKRLDELAPGEHLALPRTLPVQLAQQTMSNCAARLAAVVKSSDLAVLADSDIYWDSIVSIEPDGEEAVYDLTVPGHHNFVANNIIVHNSLEQDADVVIFIHREDMYDPNSERKNVAEIIVAKHRNGPTGSIELVFRNHLAQFVSAVRRETTL